MSEAKVSCIYLIDEFEWNDYIPWQVSFNSALAIADEVVVVKGNRPHTCKGESIAGFLKKLSDPKIKVIDYTWPQNFSWFDIAHALNAGLLNCRYEWCFRLLMDEIIPFGKFRELKKILKNSASYDILRVGRCYQLGDRHLYPYIQKELFFRNNSQYAYGRVAPSKRQPLLFDNPVKLTERTDFFKLTVASYQKKFPSYPPLGERDYNDVKTKNLTLFIINTDVNYLPDSILIKQKRQSTGGYFNLPAEYKGLYRKDIKDASIIDDHRTKIKKMLKSNKKIKYYKMPPELLDFTKQFGAEHNSVQRLIKSLHNRGGKTSG